MEPGEQWIMDPIPEGYYSLPDVRDGRVGLVDVARAHEHMAVKAANTRIARERLKNG